MADSRRRLDHRQTARPSVESVPLAHHGTQYPRGNGEVSGQWHGERDRSGLCQEADRPVRRRTIRSHREDSELARKVEGMAPKRNQRIDKAWSDQRAVRDIMLFLHAHGVGTSRAVRIYKKYG